MRKIVSKSKAGSLFSPNIIAVLIGILLVSVLFSLSTSTFLTSQNLLRLLRQMVVMMVISTGMTFVVSTGGMDISVGANYNLIVNSMALLILGGLNPWLAAVLGLVIGTVCGMLNGALAVVLDIPVIIVTLGTVNLFKGITLVLTGGNSVSNLPKTSSFFAFGEGKLGPIYLIVIAALFIVLFTALYMRSSVVPRDFMAIGSNLNASRYSGVPIKRRKIQNMAIMGSFCGLAAILSLAYLGSSTPDGGSGYEMLAITAVVAGGTSSDGGEGSVWGTLGGIVLIMIIRNGLMLMNLPAAWQEAATGILLIAAIAIQKLTRKEGR